MKSLDNLSSMADEKQENGINDFNSESEIKKSVTYGTENLRESLAEVSCVVENIIKNVEDALFEDGNENSSFPINMDHTNNLDQTRHSLKLSTECSYSKENCNKNMENTLVDDINENRLFPVRSEPNGNLTNEEFDVIENSLASNCDKSLQKDTISPEDQESLLNCGQSKTVVKNACDISNFKLLFSDNTLDSDINTKDLSQENKTLNLSISNKANVHNAGENYRSEDAFNYLSNLVKAATNKKSAFSNASSTDVSSLVKNLCFSPTSATDLRHSGLHNNRTETVRKLSVDSCIKQCSINLIKLNCNNIQMLLDGQYSTKIINSNEYESNSQNENTVKVDSLCLQSVPSDAKICDNKSVSAAISSYKPSVQLPDSTHVKGFKAIKNNMESTSDCFGSKFNEDSITTRVLSSKSENSSCLVGNDPEDIFTNTDVSNALESNFENETASNKEDTELSTLLKSVFDNINNDSDSGSEKSFELDLSYKFNLRVSYENGTIQSRSLTKNESLDVLCNRSEESVNGTDLYQCKKKLKSKSEKSHSMTLNAVNAQHKDQKEKINRKKTNLSHIPKVNESDQAKELVTKSCVVLVPRLNVSDYLPIQDIKKVNFSFSQSSAASMFKKAENKAHFVELVSINENKRKVSITSNNCMKNSKLQKKKHFILESVEQVPNSPEIIKKNLVEYKKLKENKKPNSKLKLGQTEISINKDYQSSEFICNSKKSEKMKKKKKKISSDNFSNESRTPNLSSNFKFSKDVIQEETSNFNFYNPPFSFQMENNLHREEDINKYDNRVMLPAVADTSLAKNLPEEKSQAESDSIAISFKSVKQFSTSNLPITSVTSKVDGDMSIKPCKVVAQKLNTNTMKFLNSSKTVQKKQKETNMLILENEAFQNKVDVLENSDEFAPQQHQNSLYNVVVEEEKHDFLIKPCKVILEKINIDLNILLEATNTELLNCQHNSKIEVKSAKRDKDLEDESTVFKTITSKFLESCKLDSKLETENISNSNVLESTSPSYSEHNLKVVKSVKRKSEEKNQTHKRGRSCQSKNSKSSENCNVSNKSGKENVLDSTGLDTTLQSCFEQSSFKTVSFSTMSVQREIEDKNGTLERVKCSKTKSLTLADNCNINKDLKTKNIPSDAEVKSATNTKFQNNSKCNIKATSFAFKSTKRKSEFKSGICKRGKSPKGSEISHSFDSYSELRTKNITGTAKQESKYIKNIVNQEYSNVISNSLEDFPLFEKDNLAEKFVENVSEEENCEVEEILIKNSAIKVSNMDSTVKSVSCHTLKPCFVSLKKLDLSSSRLIGHVGNIKIKKDFAESKLVENFLSVNEVCMHTNSMNLNAASELVSKELQKNRTKIVNSNDSLSVDDEIYNSSQHNFQNFNVNVDSDSSSCCSEWKEEDSEQWTISFKKRNFVNKKGEKVSKFYCIQCERNLKSAEDLFYHLCSAKKKKGFLCVNCEKMFSSCCTLTS